jgi:hypothetical protein
MENRERYRKLPGRRRGFIFGSSVWMGSDHLLLVKSARFREDYKRFYFRDVQAIVTASAPRFHISTRSALIGWLWLWASLFLTGFRVGPGGTLTWIPWVAFALFPIAWVYVSAARSCRCRIYTAVSSEELPSLYRTGTARRFLEKVEPYLTQAQGTIEGNWAEAVEDRQVGPPAAGRVGLMMPAGTAMTAPAPAAKAQTSRTPVSFLFAGCLCLGGLAELLTLRTSANAGRWILLGFLLLQLGTAVAVLVQNYLGILRPAMRNLAIVTLACIGVWYYAVQVVAGAAIGFQNATTHDRKVVQAQLQPMGLLDYPLSRGVAGGFSLLLGLVGVVLLLRGDSEEERTSFNV